MDEFIDDDDGYRSWVYSNPGGFVVNTSRTPSASYLILHRAVCEIITPTPDKPWTRGDYIKVCSNKRYELDERARSLGGRLSSVISAVRRVRDVNLILGARPGQAALPKVGSGHRA